MITSILEKCAESTAYVAETEREMKKKILKKY